MAGGPLVEPYGFGFPRSDPELGGRAVIGLARFSTRGREGPLRKVGANVDNTVFNRSSASARAQGEEPRRRAKPPGARGGSAEGPPRKGWGNVDNTVFNRSSTSAQAQGEHLAAGRAPLGREGDSPQELKMLRNREPPVGAHDAQGYPSLGESRRGSA